MPVLSFGGLPVICLEDKNCEIRSSIFSINSVIENLILNLFRLNLIYKNILYLFSLGSILIIFLTEKNTKNWSRSVSTNVVIVNFIFYFRFFDQFKFHKHFRNRFEISITVGLQKLMRSNYMFSKNVVIEDLILNLHRKFAQLISFCQVFWMRNNI